MRLRYWIKSGLQTFWITLAATAIYGLLMALQLDDSTRVISVLSGYLLAFGAIMPMAMCIGVYKFNLQLSLSFGSTRNEALLGLQLSRLIPIVLIVGTETLLAVLSGDDAIAAPGSVAGLAFGVCLIAAAIGVIVGTLFTKYGKLPAIIGGVLLFLLAVSVGVMAGMDILGDFVRSLITSPWLVAAVGLLVYALAMIPEQRTVWQCNVKL